MRLNKKTDRQDRRQAQEHDREGANAPSRRPLELEKQHAAPARASSQRMLREAKDDRRRRAQLWPRSSASSADELERRRRGARRAPRRASRRSRKSSKVDVNELLHDLRGDHDGERMAERAKAELVEANLRLVVSHRQEVHQPRPAVPRPDPGGQHRPDEGRRQVRVQARLQVLDLRHLVDPPGHHPRHRRPGAHHPHPGAHDRDDQQADPHLPLPRAGARPRADARGDRREDGAAARQGAQGPQDRQGAHLASRRRSARRRTSHLGDFIEDKSVDHRPPTRSST